MNHAETLAHIERSRAERTRGFLLAEQKQLCVAMAAMKERLFRAQLYKTGHAMDAAVKAIGYEVAEKIEAEK
jgi:hypothetical protein